ncbi:restriction endonuclease subunit S [Flavobacterium limi]|uniref:Type I restriction modification DNA specificity domain-containing protein n=1 Tax=Flavobacterium limi TaxID=2045105 RepID=A0ABQ1UZA6_9FLAO|nr:restriction endonuclease subunit S [Flavobacterium limi]GGF30039.1 hypothetical protein GCM10011518_44100 [Flavobacterium limi]
MSWKKSILGDLCTIVKGKTGIQKAIPGEFPLVVTAEERKSHHEYQFDDEAVIIPLVSGTGHGHASIKRLHLQTGKFALGTILCAVIPKDKSVLNAEYLFHFLTLNKDKELVERMKGMANVTLPIKEIAKIEIPLPSLGDQIKFVEKYKLLEKENDKIDNNFTNQLDLIKQLRQAFLREAMQGKLVKSSNITETGQQLLEKIKAEKEKLVTEKKIKKEKELPKIKDDEIPFEIPEHWAWCRLGEISNIQRGSSPRPKGDSRFFAKDETEYNWITISDITTYTKENILSKTKEYLTEIGTKHSRFVDINEFIIAVSGSTTGKCCLTGIDGYIYDGLAVVKQINKSLPSQFLMNYMTYLYAHINNSKSGASFPNINTDFLNNLLYPLPPLHEQEQIVSKLKELMTFCDDLEKSIKVSQDYNIILLQQVLREALQPKENVKTISVGSKKIENPLKTILGGHIINLNNTTDFGRVKFQKLLFLTEYICKIDFDSNYVKKVAGPYDDSLIKNIEADFNRMRFFNVIQDKTDRKRVRYTALPAANELENLFLENFSDESVKINSTILKFRPLNWGECELIATLYAVWNNRIIKNEPITDELLYSDFMEWDQQKKKYHSVFHKWLFWMKEERIIPDGWGKYIEKPNSN